MALTLPAERPFPFFTMPRELRDMVYDNLTTPMSGKIAGEGRIRHSAKVDALIIAATLVSNQFKAEASERAQAWTTLSLGDIAQSNTIALPQWAIANVAHIELTWPIFCNTLVFTTRRHLNGARQALMMRMASLKSLVMRFKHLKSIHLDIHIEWPQGGKETSLDTTHDPGLHAVLNELVAIPAVTALKIRKAAFWSLIPPQESNELWGTWDKTNGWQTPAGSMLC